MSNTSKNNASIWHGYLNAGARSSPVIIDASLDTGNPKTLYLFNLERGEIREYVREIVEPKLRELKTAESGFVADLDSGYEIARSNFHGRPVSVIDIVQLPVTEVKEKPDFYDDSENDDDFFLDDEDT